MTELLGSYEVLNRHTGDFEGAELYRTISPQHARDFVTHWRPAFLQRIARMLPGETYESAQLQDQHWEWPRKADVIRNRLDFESFAVVVGGITQGLLMLRMIGHLSWVARPAEEPIPYIELIATAPWNRRGFTATPQYKGVGELLIAAAISISVDQEFAGRLGLNAIPQSVDWYRDFCRFTEFGPNPEHPDMVYFEATEEQSKQLIARRSRAT